MQQHSEWWISVIIPCFRQAHYLRDCLDSVSGQTCPRWEAIVVDDGSPDGARIREVVESYADRRIRLHLMDRNRGLAASRNAGASLARHPLLVSLDADDKLAARYVETVSEEFAADPGLECVYTDYEAFGVSNAVSEMRLPETVAEVAAGLRMPGAGIAVRRSLWDRIGGYDESGELLPGRTDLEFNIRLAAGKPLTRHLPLPLYLRRLAGPSMCTKARLREHKLYRYIYQKHRKSFDECGGGGVFLGRGYSIAAKAALESGTPYRAVGLAILSLIHHPRPAGVRTLLRAAGAAAGLAGILR